MTLKNLACLAAGIAAGTMLIGAQAAWAQNGTIQGVVSDASGQPVVGAFVKVKNDEKRLTFMVISQERGQFSFKDLPVGTYRVQGVGQWHAERMVPGREGRVGRGRQGRRVAQCEAGYGASAGVAGTHP